MLSWFKHIRRRRLFAQAWPTDWEEILCRNVAHYGYINEDQRPKLREATRVLVAEKVWEGCGGLHVTDEMKVTIAAQASLMLLGMEHDYFDRLISILVYPSAFELPPDNTDDGNKHGFGAIGQAVYRGPVILAWDATLAEGRDPSAGHNVVIHEFAHHLDFLDGFTNGTPELTNDKQSARWHGVMSAEYTHLRQDLDQGRDTLLGDQASWNEAEFFAVASEWFFARPVPLRQRHPLLYDILAEYYRIEPIKWFSAGEMRTALREQDESHHF
jgi:MtfA peptidase